MAHWFLAPERAPPWFALESGLCGPLSPVHFIAAKLPSEVNTYPVVSHLQWTWRRVVQVHRVNPHLHLHAGIWFNPKLRIDKEPFFWKLWYRKGIKVLGDRYEKGIIRSFENMKRQFDISQNQFCCYLQLRHLLIPTFGSASAVPPSLDICHRILDIVGKGHEALAYYSMLLLNSEDALPALRLTWEADLNIAFSEENWSLILKNSKKMLRELETRLIQFKTLHRVYWTPPRLHRAGLRDDAGCWRCTVNNGTLVHMLWGCPKVQSSLGPISMSI